MQIPVGAVSIDGTVAAIYKNLSGVFTIRINASVVYSEPNLSRLLTKLDHDQVAYDLNQYAELPLTELNATPTAPKARQTLPQDNTDYSYPPDWKGHHCHPA